MVRSAEARAAALDPGTTPEHSGTAGSVASPQPIELSRRMPRRRLLAAALVALVWGGCESRSGNIDDVRMRDADSEPENWLVHGGNLQEHRFSRLTQITDTNVSNLAPAWVFEFDTFRGQQSTPIVVDGVMYVTTAMSKVYALDAESGSLLWRFDPEVPGDQAHKPCCDVTNRGPAVYKGKVYVATIDGRLIALDAATGSVVWSVVTVDQSKMYSITGAPRVVHDKVIIGNSGGEFGVRGYVGAYDAATGELVWRFYLAPGDPAEGPDHAASDDIMETLVRPTWFGDKYWIYGGGANAWSDMTYDPELNLLYVGTGNGSPWNRTFRSDGRGDNLFVASIVALDPDTGRYVWHYQENPGESWDYNAVQPIILAEIPVEGRARKVLMHAPKNGFFYVLDRTDGKLISAESYVPTTWATGIDKTTGRPVEVPGSRYENAPFTIVTSAHGWYPFAYSPQTGLVYFPAVATGTEFRQPEKFEFIDGLMNHGADHRSFIPLLPVPTNAPPLGGSGQEFLLAWDPARQKEAWRVREAGFGVLTTAGNLVFQGRAREGVMGTLVAFAADTGREVWRRDTPNAILPGPVSYAVDGVQYIAAVGGARIFGGGVRAFLPQPGRVTAFKLGGTAKLPADPRPAPPIQPPAGVWSEPAIADGRASYDRVCRRCHGFNAKSQNVIPDLRRSGALTDAMLWKQIVHDGVLTARGMVGWSRFLTPEQVENVRGFVVEQAREAAR
jgi:quinohemoprotein ethanol dehydrogenase